MSLMRILKITFGVIIGIIAFPIVLGLGFAVLVVILAIIVVFKIYNLITFRFLRKK
ncbi:MAG: hypothetical protein KAS95_09005 [Candidatus Heimdallarchaeota archaeon]|nr:hypothetical protein [Candidatus Heimdallarchaeota archaeon]